MGSACERLSLLTDAAVSKKSQREDSGPNAMSTPKPRDHSRGAAGAIPPRPLVSRPKLHKASRSLHGPGRCAGHAEVGRASKTNW